MTTALAKPPYQPVPTMAQIADLEPNGFTAASSFSGAGGSCLGYRMAGFRVAWASEFVEAARDTYRANSPGTPVDGRDIRDVTGRQVLEALGCAAGELDLFDGSPPCSAFSTAGKREAGWGEQHSYSDDKVQRVDDLFFEYIRLLQDVQPRVFVAENVSGLVKGTAKGYFKMILTRMRQAGYVVEAQLVDASWLGVPQARQRLIFQGVRRDLGLRPAFPHPQPHRYSVRDVLPWIVAQADNGGFGKGGMRPSTGPSPTIGAGPQTGNGRWPASLVDARRFPGPGVGPTYDDSGVPCDPETGQQLAVSVAKGTEPPAPGCERRRLTLGELRTIGGFPPDFVLTGTYAQRWERIGRAVPPVMMAAIATEIRDRVLNPLRDAGKI